jgi:hypothetical protein
MNIKIGGEAMEKIRMVEIGLDRIQAGSDIIRRLTLEDLGMAQVNMTHALLHNKKQQYNYLRCFVECKSLALYPSLIYHHEEAGLIKLAHRWAHALHPANDGYRTFTISTTQEENGEKISKPFGSKPKDIEINMLAWATRVMYGNNSAMEGCREFMGIYPFAIYNHLIADLFWRLMYGVENEEFPTHAAPISWTNCPQDVGLIPEEV